MTGAQLVTDAPKSGEGSYSSEVNCQEELRLDLNCFRKTGEYCDISIIVADKKYPAHKLLLSSISPFFKACFSGEFSESSEASVEIKNIDAPTMELVLEYIYDTCKITEANAVDLLDAANFFQISSLYEHCVAFLETTCNAKNCLGIYKRARTYNRCSMLMKAKECSLTNFIAVCAEDEFLELNAEDLIALLADNLLKVRDEEEVFNAVVRWLKYKEEERTPLLPEIVAHVRLAHIKEEFLYCEVETLPAFKNSPTCMRLLQHARLYQTLSQFRLELQSSVTRRRGHWQEIEAMVMSVKYPGEQNEVLIFLREDGRFVRKWSKAPNYVKCFYASNSQKCCLGVTLEQIYCASNTSTASWICVGSSPNSRRYFGFAEVNDVYFMIGGILSDGGVCGNVDTYRDRKWTAVSSLPIPVCSPAVVTVRGNIYVLGGFDNIHQSTNAVQRYNRLSDTWTQVAPLPAKQGEFKACVIHDEIYVCQFPPSGVVAEVDDCRHVYVYNVPTNNWRTCCSLSHSFVSGPVPFNGNIFALTERADEERVLEKYSPSSDTWEDFATFPEYKPQLITGPLITNNL